MTENWIVQIDFKDQRQYEVNKGYIKDLIKNKHQLLDFDALTQCWYNKSISGVVVKRLVDGFKTVGLKVAGNKAIADSLIVYVKDMIGVSVTWLDDPIDQEVSEIVEVENRKFSAYINNRVMKGEVSRDVANSYIKRWLDAVTSFEYERRGFEY